MFREYQKTGYVWEQYDDKNGSGKVGTIHMHTHTHTHTQKKQSLSLPITGHAFLDKPGHLCTKQVRCAGAMSTPGARARNSQEVPTMPPTAGVGTL